MFELQRLGPDHEPAVLAFEQKNRAYLAEFISDRGDDFFAQFAERYSALLAEQEAGDCVFYVLVDEEENVVGRFNLYDLVDGTARRGSVIALPTSRWSWSRDFRITGPLPVRPRAAWAADTQGGD